MGEEATLRIPSATLKDLARIRRFIETSTADWPVQTDALYDLLLSVTELVTNTIVHGYRGKPGPVEVQVGRSGTALVVRLRDSAPPYDPNTAPIPDVTLPLELRQPGGLGIYLCRHYLDSMQHRSLPGQGNELVLRKEGALTVEGNHVSDS